MNLVSSRDIDMGDSETERSWSSDDFTVLVILRAVARALKLVGVLVPWNNAAQMGADGIDTEIFNTIGSRNEVGGITFESLNKLAIAIFMS